MSKRFSQLLCLDTIRDANNHLEPGQRTMLACENKPHSTVKPALSIFKDENDSLWVEPYEHNLVEKIIETYADHAKRQILLCIEKSTTKEEMLKKSGLSQSSSYRKFNELLDDGFILAVGYTKNENRVRVYDKIISTAEFSVSTKTSQIRLQVNLSRLPGLSTPGIVYP